MKVCPKCKRIYEDAQKLCPHDNTPLQAKTDAQKPTTVSKANPSQTDMPKLDPISQVAQEAEQQRLKTERTVLKGLGAIAGILLLLLLGGSPWMGVHPPSSESQTETVVAVNEQPASPAPAQPASSAAQVAQKQAAKPPETAKVEPEPEKAVTAEESGSAPEPKQGATAEESATAPEPEANTEEPAPTPEPEKNVAEQEAVTEGLLLRSTPEPAQRAATEESAPTPEPEKSMTVQESARIAGQGKEARRRVDAEGRQVQSAPSGQKPKMQTRPEEKKPRTPMVWIYKTKTATSLLSKAKTGASVVKQLKSGEQLRIVGDVGDYFEVRSSGDGASSAYVRPKDVTLVRIE